MALPRGAIADAFALPFLLVPRRWRFAAARRVALLATPLLGRLSASYTSALDGPRERALRLVTHSLRRLRIHFDPDLRVEGPELPEGGVLLVSAHFLLTMLFVRRLLDAGSAPAVVARNPPAGTCHAGTDVPIEYLKSGPAVLHLVRKKLAEGRKVFLAVDATNPRHGWPCVDTAGGRRWISGTAFELAERTGVPVFFVAVTLDRDGAPVARVVPAPRGSAEAMHAFTAFLVETTAAMHR